jgi:hypothetical protein
MTKDEKFELLICNLTKDVIEKGKILKGNDFLILNNRVLLSKWACQLKIITDVFPNAVGAGTWKSSLYFRDGYNFCIFLNDNF